METITAENKELFLLGHFYVDLLKICDDNKIDEFYNVICTNLLVPHLNLPTRKTGESATQLTIFSQTTLTFHSFYF